MLRHTIIYVFGLTSVVCFGYEAQFFDNEQDLQGKRGAVFQWAPEEKVKLMILDYEPYKGQLKDKHIQFPVTANDLEKKGVMRCNTFQKNVGKGKDEVSQTRVSILVRDHGFEGEETELEDFEVTTCNEEVLINSFIISAEVDNKYSIIFKDKNNKCFRRNIEVKVREQSIIIKRDDPVWKNCRDRDIKDVAAFQRTPGIVVPNKWMDSEELFDVDHRMVYESTTIDYDIKGNDNKFPYTYLSCKSVTKNGNEFKVVDIFFTGAPIDRVYANSCSQYSLQTSIVMTKHTKDDGNRVRHIYIDFLDTKGNCKRRHYMLDKWLVKGDSFVMRAELERFPLYKSDCYTQKARGYVRKIGHLTGLRRILIRGGAP